MFHVIQDLVKIDGFILVMVFMKLCFGFILVKIDKFFVFHFIQNYVFSLQKKWMFLKLYELKLVLIKTSHTYNQLRKKRFHGLVEIPAIYVCYLEVGPNLAWESTHDSNSLLVTIAPSKLIPLLK